MVLVVDGSYTWVMSRPIVRLGTLVGLLLACPGSPNRLGL